MKSSRDEMVENMERIRELLPDCIEFVKKIPEKGNFNFWVLSGVDIRKAMLLFEYLSEQSKK